MAPATVSALTLKSCARPSGSTPRATVATTGTTPSDSSVRRMAGSTASTSPTKPRRGSRAAAVTSPASVPATPTAAGAAAGGVAGTDAGLVTAAARDPRLGFVGDVLAVDPAILLTLLSDGVVPVVATVARGVDPAGRAQDVNADTVAGAIAVALGADKLILLSNVPGLYEEFGTADSSLLSEVDAGRLQGMLDRGELHTGMVPKVRSIIEALAGGVARAHLLDGRIEHALLLEIFTDEGIGTMVLPDPTQHPAPRTRAGELRVTGGTGTPRTGTPRTGTPSPGLGCPGLGCR